MAGRKGFELPGDANLIKEDGSTSTVWLNWLSRIHTIVLASTNSGTTAQRPDRFVWVGRRYYDETLNKPVYVSSVNPIVWRDAAGTIV